MGVIFYYRKPSDQIFYPPPTDWLYDRVVTNLTIGKKYEVINIGGASGRYYIVADDGIIDNFPTNLFTSVDDIRNEKINSILSIE